MTKGSRRAAGRKAARLRNIAPLSVLAGVLWLAPAGAQVTSGVINETPVGTGFTYQGELRRDGAPADTTCSLRFSLLSAAAGGVQHGNTLTIDGVAVIGGRFTVVLDFGESFGGGERWLETEVRCTGDAAFTSLSPRQPLTATPYALGLRPGTQVTGAVDFTSVLSAVNSGQSGSGVLGRGLGMNTAGVVGIGEGGPGVDGVSTDGPGVQGTSTAGVGVQGNSTTSAGVRGETSGELQAGVVGIATGVGFGLVGVGDSAAPAVFAVNQGAGNGLNAVATSGVGIHGESFGSTVESPGVHGESNEVNGVGVLGTADEIDSVGVWGRSTANTGVYGLTTTGRGIYGDNLGSNNVGFAGFFNGRVHVGGNLNVANDGHVIGNLTKGGGSFLIDHPLDPANKILQHSFVESPDMKNVYDGIVTTDDDGLATVQLPAYFEALNGDYRYQLTVIGAFARAVVWREIENGAFQISTDEPAVKVSWQVTGIRRDPYAERNRIAVEEEKPAEMKGRYLHPAAYDLPASAAMDWQPGTVNRDSTD
jgi:hypothetical protein